MSVTSARQKSLKQKSKCESFVDMSHFFWFHDALKFAVVVYNALLLKVYFIIFCQISLDSLLVRKKTMYLGF